MSKLMKFYANKNEVLGGSIEVCMIVIEIILRVIGYFVIGVGGYVLIGALSLWCSIFSIETDTFKKCIKKSFVNTVRMRPWYDKIDN